MSILRATIAVSLISMVGVALPSSAQEQEEQGISVEHSGSFFSRYELRRNWDPLTAAHEGSDAVRYRARLGLKLTGFSLDEMEMGVRFVPQVGGFWGVTGQLSDPSVGLHQAALDLTGENANIEIGRFEMHYGDGLLVGHAPWHHLGRAFDGLRVNLTPGSGDHFIDMFVTTLAEGMLETESDEDLSSPVGVGDYYFVGLYGGMRSLLSDDDQLDLYFLGRLWPDEIGETEDMATEATLGFRVKNSVGFFDYRTEAGVQIGTRPSADGGDNPSVMAYQFDVEMGVTASIGSGLRLSVEGLMASGDDPETEEREDWFHLYSRAHKWLGFLDFVGPRTNVTSAAFHVRQKIGDSWQITSDAHSFWRPETSAEENYLGSEVDLGVVYFAGSGLKIRTGYSLFFQEESLGDELLQYGEIEARFDF
jgi:hypothetical protein